MKKHSFFRSTVAAVLVAGSFVGGAAHADNLTMSQDINSLGFTVSIDGKSDNVTAGIFNVSNLNSGKSFLAFCYELTQGVGAATSNPPGLPFSIGTPDVSKSAVQTLFNQSFAGLNLNSLSEVAGFQIALWESYDDHDLNGSSGHFSGWTSDGSAAGNGALAFANTLLNRLDSNAPLTGNYDLTVWSNPNSQDLVEAERSTGNKVPEPATSALAALGLAGLALARRRKG